MQRSTRPPSGWTIATVVLVGAGIALMLFHTRAGPGVTGDSVHYVMGAENLLAGRGYARTGGGGEAIPITAFPPGYSWVLALGGLFSEDIFEIGRWLSAISFGSVIGLTSWLVFRHTSNAVAAALAAGLVLLAEDLIQIYSWVMSEPTYILFTLLGILALARYLESGRLGYLIGSGLLIAASTLVRYVGLSLFGAGALALLTYGRKNLTRRMIDIGLFAMLNLLPLFVWFARNAALGGSLTNRALGFHPLSAELGIIFLGTANAWFFPLTLGLPREFRGLLSLSIVLVILGAYLVQRLRDGALWRQPERDHWALPWILLLFISIYLFSLVFNTSFLDASTTRFGAARYLTPVLICSIILLTTAAARLWSEYQAKWIWRRLLQGLALLLLMTYGIRAVQVVQDPGKAFRYTDVKNDSPALVDALNGIDDRKPLLSNDIELIYALTDRPAYRFPIAYDHYIEQPREDLQEQIAFTREQLDEGGVIVLFDSPSRDDELDILRILDAEPLYEVDGAYFYTG